MDQRDGSGERLPAEASAPAVAGEVVPCPRCGLLAPVLPPAPQWTYPETRCARGHFSVLIPVVLEHIRARLGAAYS